MPIENRKVTIFFEIIFEFFEMRVCWSFRATTAGGYFFVQQGENDAM